MKDRALKNIIEAALLAAGKPLSVERIIALFEEGAAPERDAVRAAVQALSAEYQTRGIEIRQVASGYRLQVKKEFGAWVSRLWEEKPARYTRALLETLALIAYRQPVTRGDIEEVRGVSVSAGVMKTLQEREWIRVLGHRDAPGKPALYGTTKAFLDHFNLKSLDRLPMLPPLRDIDAMASEFAAGVGDVAEARDVSADVPTEAPGTVAPEAASRRPH